MISHRLFLSKTSLPTILSQVCQPQCRHGVLHRSFKTSQPRPVFELLTTTGFAYSLKLLWPKIPLWGKWFSAAMLPATGLLMARYIQKRTKFDPVLGRKKFMSSNVPPMKIGKDVKFLDGEPVQKANDLLNSIVDKAKWDFIGVDHPRHQWKLLVFANKEKFYQCTESGTIFISKDILLRLSERELKAFLSLQVAHILAKHITEFLSMGQLINYTLALLAAPVVFFMPTIHSIPVDMAFIVTSYFLLGYPIGQIKYKSLLREADQLSLKIGKDSEVTKDDLINLLNRLHEASYDLPFFKKYRGYCYYNTRINYLKSFDPNLVVESK